MFSALNNGAIESFEIENTQDEFDTEFELETAELLFEDQMLDGDAQLREFSALEQLSETLDDMETLHDVISKHGISPAMLELTNRDNLLSGVVPAFQACEGLGVAIEASAPQAQAVLEGLGDVISNTVAAWFKKAWDAVSGLASKIGDMAKLAYEKIEAGARWVAGKVYNAAKAAKEVITAHPVASALAAVATAVALTTAISAIWEIPLPISAETLGSWKTTVLNKIGSATSSVGRGIVSVSKSGVEYARIGASSVKKGAGTALGYTSEQFSKLSEATKAAFSEGGSVRKMGEMIKSGSSRLFEGAKKAGGEALRYARSALSFLMSITHSAWRFISGGVVALATHCMSVFRSFFGTKEEVEHYSETPSAAAAALRRSAASASNPTPRRRRIRPVAAAA